jgi:signal transduction histidine kinase/CheY-like chemotaxis protein
MPMIQERRFWISWRAWSLRTTLLVGAGASILLPVLVLGYSQASQRLATEIKLRVNDPMQQYADVLAEGTARALWEVAPESVTKISETIMHNTDVVAITITNDLGVVFFDKHIGNKEESGILHAERDIIYNGMKIGHLVIEASTQRVAHALWADLLRLGVSLMFQVAFSVGFLWILFNRRLIAPFRLLQEGAMRLARGELNHPIAIGSDDEIGSLSRGLDRMRMELSNLNAEREKNNVNLRNELQLRLSIEGELVRHKEHLEDLVNERTLALSAARQQADAANRAKSVFLANMSHELRTPLNAILGFARILERDKSIKPEHQQNLATINRSGQHLLRLINDVLEISRIEAGRNDSKLAAFELGEMIADLEAMTRGRAQEKGLKFTVHRHACLPKYVFGDAHHLKQILINLLGNAVKYTDKGQVSFHIDTHNEQICFEIADTGHGISKHDQVKLFQPFFQTEHGVEKADGTGLGLSISQEYAHLLGSVIEIDSDIGKGSRFTLKISLPEVEAPMEESKRQHGQILGLEAGSQAPRVLVVDDKQDNRELVRQMLEMVDIVVQTADDGQQAVDAFTRWQPQLIWMDMRMPVMDGYEATRQIRLLPGGADVKIVALTATAFEEDIAAVREAGCDDIIKKPVEQEHLLEVMGRLLDLRYRYSTDIISESAEPAVTIDLSGVTDLTSALRLQLKDAADALDLKSLQSIVQEIALHDSDLARKLETLIAAFRFDLISSSCV